MRDPMNVTAAYPMPEGAHFCGPVAVEGSAPYKEMAPGTNAFDYTQIEEQLKKLHEMERRQQVQQHQQQQHQQQHQQQQQQQQQQPVASAEAPEKGATMPFTPQQDGSYDPNVYLQVKIRVFFENVDLLLNVPVYNFVCHNFYRGPRKCWRT